MAKEENKDDSGGKKIDKDNVSGDRSFKVDKAVKAWYVRMRRRKRQQS